MSAQEPPVGVIGLRYGRAHIPAFQANGCKVVAVCQRDQAGATQVADRYGVPRVFDSWERMIDEAWPEIVVVATPPVLHHAIVLRAFEAGAHVLCEKPLAMSRAEAQAMVDAAARAGRIAMTAFNWRFTAAMLQFHATVGEPVVGRVCSTRCSSRRGAAPGSTFRGDDGPPDQVAAGAGGANLSRLRFPSLAEQPGC